MWHSPPRDAHGHRGSLAAETSAKRGPQAPVSASAEDVAAPDALEPIDVLALDEALRRLSELDARQAQIVELRFFGGLTLGEIAAMFGSLRTHHEAGMAAGSGVPVPCDPLPWGRPMPDGPVAGD